jgi:hypothetical protein
MTPELQADCARCAALCCVALALPKGDAFAIDKPNGVPCPHLDGHECATHARRDAEGFSGCVRYDCAGAGQRVTQELFAGRSWRDDPDLLAPMTRAFAAMQRIHDLIVLLREAEKAPLSAEERAAIAAFRARAEGLLTQDALLRLDDGLYERDVRAFLGTLQKYFATE